MPDEFPSFYANVVQITSGPFDLTMDFGFKTPEQLQAGGSAHDRVARVSMSLSHAKSMLPLLARAIADYESQVGSIPAPGFETDSKG